MLPSQRELFDIPRDVCYLNAAAWGPMPLAVQEAGRAAMNRKGQPWKLTGDFYSGQYERARKAAAALIGADPNDVALISSVGYGVSTAGKVLPIARGSRVLVLQNDHTSPVLEWMGRAEAQGFTVETVKQPADADWTTAVLEAIERKGAAPLALASISSVHWSDGGAIDRGGDPHLQAVGVHGADGVAQGVGPVRVQRHQHRAHVEAAQAAQVALQPVAAVVRHARGDRLHEARAVRTDHGHDQGGVHHSSSSTFQ